MAAPSSTPDLAALLASLALAAQPAGAQGRVADVVLIDNTRVPMAVHAASGANLAAASVFFAGLLADGNAPGSAPAVFVVSAAGCEPSAGVSRLPLPAPAAFHHLLPFLDSAGLNAGALKALRTLNCDDACAVFANASFLGVGAGALDVLIVMLSRLWPSLIDAPGFSPDFVSPDALQHLLRVVFAGSIDTRALLTGEFSSANAVSATQAVLRWAQRGGWGAAQSDRLRQLLRAVGPAPTSAEGLAQVVQTVGVSDALLDVVAPAPAARKHMATLHRDLLSTRQNLSLVCERLEACSVVHCVNCDRDVLATEMQSEGALCDRNEHTGEYSNGYGWSCCREKKKRVPPCGTVYRRHGDALFSFD